MDMVDTSFFLLGHFFPQRYAVHVELHVSSSFPSAEWRKKMQKEIKRKEQEKLWLQDKLLTSTYNTGPDGFVYVNLKTNETAEKQTSQRRKHT
jgi:hypothetical protein